VEALYDADAAEGFGQASRHVGINFSPFAKDGANLLERFAKDQQKDAKKADGNER
jgi:hypothetical protein